MQRILWYTFALVALFLVLSRYNAANTLLRSGFRGYAEAVGTLQGRTISRTGTIGGIAR
jgi:hypothetical protein